MSNAQSFGSITEVNEKIVLLKERIDAAIDAELEATGKEHPDLLTTVGFKRQNIYYKKRPPGFSKVMPDIVVEMLLPGGIKKTQQQIIDSVGMRHPLQDIKRSIWTRPLQSYEKKMIETKMRGNMRSSMDISDCKTLAQIRRKLIRYFNRQEGKPYAFKAKFEINKDLVVVNSKLFPITWRKSGDKTYPCIRVSVKDKRHWLRVDVLSKMLLDAT